MVDLHMGQDSMPLKDPIDLLFFTPHNIPIILVCLLPLSIVDRLVDTIPKTSFKFDISRRVGIVLFFDISSKVLRHGAVPENLYI